MISFPISRLIDDPELDHYAFIPENTKPVPGTYDFTIYVVSTETEVLYVGKSDDCCFDRLRTHLGHSFRGRPGKKSTLGEWVERSLPESRSWRVDLYTNEDTKKIVDRKRWEGFVFWPTDFAEGSMIHTLKPRLNMQLTSSYKRR
jgi:hypothetical protein